MSSTTTLVDRAVDAINAAVMAGTIDLPFAARKAYDLDSFLEAVDDDLDVACLPASKQAVPASRLPQDDEALSVIVAVGVKIKSQDEAEIEPLLNLAEAIGDAVRKGAASSSYRFSQRTNDPAFDDLDTTRKFLSAETFVFRRVRDI